VSELRRKLGRRKEGWKREREKGEGKGIGQDEGDTNEG